MPPTPSTENGGGDGNPVHETLVLITHGIVKIVETYMHSYLHE